MFEQINPTDLIETIRSWLLNDVLTVNSFAQVGILATALVLSYFIYRKNRIKIREKVKALDTSPRIKQTFFNISRLLLPIVALVFLSVFKAVHSVGVIPVTTNLIDAGMALLSAWIVIRLAVQFIENSFVRNAFAITIWAIAALHILGILDDTSMALDSVGIDVGEGLRLSALTVIKGLFALCLLLYVAIFASSQLERRIDHVEGLTVGSKVLVSKIIRITLITLALLIGVTTAGVDLSLLAVFSGAVGLGIGFGLQKVISNLFSGMLLLLDKSIKPGDIIEIPGGTFGWVEHMGARYTEIITRDNKSFLIPNEDFITQQVVNWSHGSTLIRIEVEFGVDYRHNPHEIKAIAEKAAILPDRVRDDPMPVCHFVEFGESSLRFKLRFWIKDAEKGVTNMRGAVMLALWDAFQENNIKIPYPHRNITITEKEKAA